MKPSTLLDGLLMAIVVLAFHTNTSSAQSERDFIFGVTQSGGMYGNGTAYRILPNGELYSTFMDLPESISAGYGGAVQMQLIGGILFLSAEDKRYLFKYATSGGSSIGRYPFTAKTSGGLMFAHDAGLYGLTYNGGASNNGALYRSVYSANSTTPTTLFEFDGVNSGRAPRGNVIQGPDSKLFGMTELGGTTDKGVIFSVQTYSTSSFKKLFDFNGTNGANPVGSLILASDGFLYGMTKSGGVNNLGVVFKIAIDGTGFTKLLDFSEAIGSTPLGSLIQFTDGKLYGTTSAGGANHFGTIFSITTAGAFTKILDFDGNNGKKPVGDLLIAPSGTVMYGTAYAGGANNLGTLFKVENGTQFTKLYDYDATGGNPIGSLVMYRDYQTLTYPPIPQIDRLQFPVKPQATSPTGTAVYFAIPSTNPGEIGNIENNQVTNIVQDALPVYAYHPGNYRYSPVTQRPPLFFGYPLPPQQIISVVKANQTIAFKDIPQKTFGDAPFTIEALATSGLATVLESSNSNIISISGNTATINGGGRVRITAYQYGNNNFNLATASIVLTVNKATQSISFDLPGTTICCYSMWTNPIASSGLPVSLRSNNELVAKGVEESVVAVTAGTAEIVAYNPGDEDYLPAEAKKTIKVLKASQSIIVDGLPDELTFRTGFYYVNVYADGGNVQVTADPPGIASIEGSYLFTQGFGETTLTFSQPGNLAYNAAPSITRVIKVNPPAIAPTTNVISFTLPSSYLLLDQSANLMGNASSGLPVTYTSSDPSVASVSNGVLKLLKEGTTSITARQAGNAAFPQATPVTKTTTVSKQYQEYDWPMIPSFPTAGDPPVYLPKFTKPGLPINYTSSDPNVVEVENGVMSFVGGGSARITVSQEGNNLYHSLGWDWPISVYGLNQSINFEQIPVKRFGDEPFAVQATTSSGIEAVFTSGDPSIATVNGNIVTIRKPGTVTINAYAPPRPPYKASNSTSRILTIDKASQSITFAALSDKNFSDPSFTVSAASTSKLPVTFSTTTPNVISVSGNIVAIHSSGVANITASQIGDETYLPATAAETFTVSDYNGTGYSAVVASWGGPDGNGHIFEVASNGSGIAPVVSFPRRTYAMPQGGFIKASDGKVYGTIQLGGDNMLGHIVRLNDDGTGYTSVFSYTAASGYTPGGDLIEGADGYFYLTTPSGGRYGKGTVLKVLKDGSDHKVLYHFSDMLASPYNIAMCLAADGKLYGISPGGFFGASMFFRIGQNGEDFEMIKKIESTYGSESRGKLMQLPDGSFIATFRQGGSNHLGAVLKLTDAGDIQPLVTFAGASNGSVPTGGILLASDGKLYGTAQQGGANAMGNIFSLNATGGGYTKLFDFSSANGISPSSTLTEASDGKLYGTAASGGSGAAGVVFRINKDGSDFSVVHNFSKSTGAMPLYGQLLESTPGNFFGMTFTGGASDIGVIYKVTATGEYTVIKDYTKQEGSPISVIQDNVGDRYYGITSEGRPGFSGALFSVKSDGSDYKIIREVPLNESISMIRYISGHIWGAVGPSGGQSMFRMKPDGSEYTVVVNFNAMTGGSPVDFIEHENHVYGMTRNSTPSSRGTFFRINKDGTNFEMLGNIPASIARAPDVMMLGSDRKFYAANEEIQIFSFDEIGNFAMVKTLGNYYYAAAMTELNNGDIGIVTLQGGVGDAGDILAIAKNGSSVRTIYNLNDISGRAPETMLQAADGWIYVSTRAGGPHDEGAVFKVRPDGSGMTTLFDLGDNSRYANSMFFIRKNQSFTFAPISPKKLSDPPFAPAITRTSPTKVKFESSDPNIARVENGLIVPAGLGTVTITASLPGNANYYPASSTISHTFTIGKGDQTIAFDPLNFVRVGSDAIVLTRESSAGLPITYESSDPFVALTSGNEVYVLKRGTVVITASQTGNDMYHAAMNVQQTLKVYGDGIQAIIFPEISTVNIESNVILPAAKATSNLPVTYTAITPNISVSGNVVTLLEEGEATIEAMQYGDEEWFPAASVSRTFTIVTTGLNDEVLFVIDLFPNPATTKLNFSIAGPTRSLAIITLINNLGQTVLSNSVDANGSINIEDLSPGVYIAKIEVEGKVVLRRILKNSR